MGGSRVVFFRDYPEEGFPSMEVYADNLISQIQKSNSEIYIEDYIGLSALSRATGYHSLKTRFLFRYLINPVCSFFHQGDVNHIVDQTNGHLLYFLDPEKTIITIHDLDVLRLKFLKWPDLRSKVIRLMYLFSIYAIRRAVKIITVSEDTKKDVVRYLGIPEEKIIVIPEGAEKIFRKINYQKELDKVATKYHLPKKFILHVGQTWDYKNIEGIIKVFDLLKKDPKNKHLFFVKIGADWSEKQSRLINRLKLDKWIIKLPFIPKADLPHIYNLASCLVQLSFLEGFGLTVLEAMSCGCPVVVSGTPALIELVDTAGLVVGPKQYHLASSQIGSLLHNQTKWRKYSLAGITRSKKFSWEKCALSTIKIYETVSGT